MEPLTPSQKKRLAEIELKVSEFYGAIRGAMWNALLAEIRVAELQLDIIPYEEEFSKLQGNDLDMSSVRAEAEARVLELKRKRKTFNI